MGGFAIASSMFQDAKPFLIIVKAAQSQPIIVLLLWPCLSNSNHQNSLFVLFGLAS
jgi:hypothetical protein